MVCGVIWDHTVGCPQRYCPRHRKDSSRDLESRDQLGTLTRISVGAATSP